MENNSSQCNFKLRCELHGHSLDVRAVTEGRDCIISGSRDKTAKIWALENGEYKEKATLTDHRNFLSSVYYLEDEGWICTGSNDSTICVYKEGHVRPFATLLGHEGTVCAITKGLCSKTILSGSWDHTGRIWCIDEDGSSTSIILRGHEAAVWAVTTIKNKKYISGSADKKIIFWNSSGEKIKVLQGHKDCVRGLVGLKDGKFVSCSNDATIRYWSEDGECLRELYGHENYIYTIALNSKIGEDIVISGGEDSTVRIWELTSGTTKDTIAVPAQSIWSVACLQNGDIVTGSSDGVIRIFTKDPSLFATTEIIESYNVAVESRLKQKDETLGGMKRTDLPGPESLLKSGSNGEQKMIRQPDGKVMCYQWENNQWNIVGEVMGASGGTQESSGKTLFEGKEYDFVFRVDISDNMPPLKLPYNRGEDPWHVAQNFIYKNNLPQVYLDQVANFIVTNSGVNEIQQTHRYTDPFTGGSRYIPGSTGPNVSGEEKHFPQTILIALENYDPAKILLKLKEFNIKAQSTNTSVTVELLQQVIQLTEKEPEINTLAIESLMCIIEWSKDILFPVLDVVRLAVRNEEIFASLDKKCNIVDILIGNLGECSANQLMAVRGIANMIIHSKGCKKVRSKLQSVVDGVSNIKHGSANLQIAIASLYFNLSVSQVKFANAEECHIITEGILEFLKWCTDLEAFYKSFQSLGNLISTPFGATTVAQMVSMDYIMDKIRQFSSTEQPAGYKKVSECANALLLVL